MDWFDEMYRVRMSDWIPEEIRELEMEAARDAWLEELAEEGWLEANREMDLLCFDEGLSFSAEFLER